VISLETIALTILFFAQRYPMLVIGLIRLQIARTVSFQGIGGSKAPEEYDRLTRMHSFG